MFLTLDKKMYLIFCEYFAQINQQNSPVLELGKPLAKSRLVGATGVVGALLDIP